MLSTASTHSVCILFYLVSLHLLEVPVLCMMGMPTIDFIDRQRVIDVVWMSKINKKWWYITKLRSTT